MRKKNCELCGKKRARMYCESDEASLCWDCDSKVHGANFLVAKHSRNLLCHSCQSPTPWSASGPKLSPTLSACTCCLDNTSSMLSEESVDETETDGDDDDDDSVDSETDAENQVVPWSSSPARSVTSCSSTTYDKRSRESDSLHFSSDLLEENNSIRPVKKSSVVAVTDEGEIVSSFLRFHQQSHLDL